MKLFAVLLVALATASSQIHVEEGSSAVRIDFQNLSGNRSCDGTLINSEYVITSAGCSDGAYSADVYVYAGYNGTFKNVVPASSFITHIIYDLCLIHGDFSLESLNISFPSIFTGDFEDGQVGTYVTWGPKPLQSVDVTVLANADCSRLVPYFFCTNICVNHPGAGLMVKGVLAGVVSWTLGRCRPESNFQGIYSNLQLQRDWIREVTGL